MTCSILEHLADNQGDRDASGAGTDITFCNVLLGIRRGSVSVSIVDHGVVSLVHELPENGVYRR